MLWGLFEGPQGEKVLRPALLGLWRVACGVRHVASCCCGLVLGEEGLDEAGEGEYSAGDGAEAREEVRGGDADGRDLDHEG